MRKYYKHGGAGIGELEDKLACVVSVYSDFVNHQCQRKRGYGPRGEYCKQHAKMLKEGKYLYVPKDK